MEGFAPAWATGEFRLFERALPPATAVSSPHRWLLPLGVAVGFTVLALLWSVRKRGRR